MSVQPVLRYPGAKWSKAQWIINNLPPFTQYVEPFFGSGAVFFSLPKPPAVSVLNDIDKNVVNLFRVLRESPEELIDLVTLTPWSRDEYEESYKLTGDPLEDARRFLVRCWQAHGTRTSNHTGWRNIGAQNNAKTYGVWNKLPTRIAAIIERLKQAEIENRDALEVMHRYRNSRQCLLYVDPPYLLSTRSGKAYAYEMKESDHIAILETTLKHAGPVVISGYESALYNQYLSGWAKVTTKSLTEKCGIKEEVLWVKSDSTQERLWEVRK